MADEKRMIQDYEVKTAIHIGNKEIILAEDMKAREPYMVCNCQWDNPFGAEIYDKAVVTADYMEAMTEFLGRVSAETQQIAAQRTERGVAPEPLTAADCIPDSRLGHYENQLVVIKPESMVASARTADMQLLLATSGNGCNPEAQGQAVFCKNLFTGKTTRWERTDVAGIIQPERVPEWAHTKLHEMGITLDPPPFFKVYMPSLEEAVQNNEVSMFHKSNAQNTACAQGIHKAINDNSGENFHYDMAAALKTVADLYGMERVQMVLANTVDLKPFDGRFTHENKQWAQGIALPQQTKQQRSAFVCDTHPALLDGFLTAMRKQQRAIEKKPSVMDQLKTQGRKPPAVKKDKPHHDKESR